MWLSGHKIQRIYECIKLTDPSMLTDKVINELVGVGRVLLEPRDAVLDLLDFDPLLFKLGV
jgi:hypothetical protein